MSTGSGKDAIWLDPATQWCQNSQRKGCLIDVYSVTPSVAIIRVGDTLGHRVVLIVVSIRCQHPIDINMTGGRGRAMSDTPAVDENAMFEQKAVPSFLISGSSSCSWLDICGIWDWMCWNRASAFESVWMFFIISCVCTCLYELFFVISCELFPAPRTMFVVGSMRTVSVFAPIFNFCVGCLDVSGSSITGMFLFFPLWLKFNWSGVFVLPLQLIVRWLGCCSFLCSVAGLFGEDKLRINVLCPI